MNAIAASLPPVVATTGAVQSVPTFNPTDLERLRSLIQSTAAQTANPLGVSGPVDATSAAEATGKVRTFGDSILQGMLRFGDNYERSMGSIETRLQTMVANESQGLHNFSELVALQIDVSKWSMSVMGVDNAAKAGSNTVKELSRGG